MGVIVAAEAARAVATAHAAECAFGAGRDEAPGACDIGGTAPAAATAAAAGSDRQGRAVRPDGTVNLLG